MTFPVSRKTFPAPFPVAGKATFPVGKPDGGGGGAPLPWRPNLGDIPGLLFWFDTTDPGKMSLDPFGGIDLFIPQVGNTGSYTMVQAVEANRPFTAPAPNGKDVVSFPAGNNRWLEKTNAPLNNAAGVSTVLAWNTVDFTNRGFCCLQGPNFYRIDLGSAGVAVDTLRYRYGGGTGGNLANADATASTGQWHVSATRAQASWIDGNPSPLAAGASFGENPNVTLQYGRVVTTQMAGELGHWIVIEGLASDEILRKLEGFVAWDLGFESQLPPGHPWKDQAP